MIGLEKDFETCIEEVERFLPYIDNWATCDQLSPRVFRKHRAGLLPRIEAWLSSDHCYTIRFGIGTLMQQFLDEDFRPEYAARGGADPFGGILCQHDDCLVFCHGAGQTV